MNSIMTPEALELLPFWVTGPGETDGLKIVVAIVLVLVLAGFGALYFTIQAIPDRMASGAHKIQVQFVSVLGLVSLLTMNNTLWIAAILIAAIPLHEVIPSLRQSMPVDLPSEPDSAPVTQPETEARDD